MAKRNTDERHTAALVIEGGAMRSVFSAGLLDGFLKAAFNPFDFYIGVSAGAGNLAAFLAGTAGRKIYLDLALRPEFISYRRFVQGGHFVDLDWLLAQTFAGDWRDVPAAVARGRPLYVGVTDVTRGEPEYVRADAGNLPDLIKASTALPLFYRGFPDVGGRPKTDGGIADGIPVKRALELGATRIMVIRSRSSDYRKRDTWMHRYIRWRLRRHNLLVAAMEQRVRRHEAVVELLRHPPPGVVIVDVCPPAKFTLGRFSLDHAALARGYDIGMASAADAVARWSSPCGRPGQVDADPHRRVNTRSSMKSPHAIPTSRS